MHTQSASTVARTGTIASLPFVQEIMSLCYDLRWLMLLCLVLIIADFKFGMENSKAHGTPIRFSNAWRRTVNKAVDYVCWVFVGGLLGKAIAEPFGFSTLVVAATIVLVASLIEIDSIIQNYYEARGIEGMTLRVLLRAWLGTRNPEMAGTLHDSFKDVHREEVKNEE